MKELKKADQESFWVLGYNKKYQEILRKCVFLGGLDGVSIYPRIVFKRLLNAGALSWAAIHNHPSGGEEPSRADFAFTSTLKSASELLGLHLLDVIIIGEYYFSFHDNGLLHQKEALSDKIGRKVAQNSGTLGLKKNRKSSPISYLRCTTSV